MPPLPDNFYVTKVECTCLVALNKTANIRTFYVRTVDRSLAIRTVMLQLTERERKDIEFIHAPIIEWCHITDTVPVLEPIKGDEPVEIA